MITLEHYLVISAVLLALGLFAVMTKRNGIAVLMGIELILNAANINLVAFSRFTTHFITGQVFAIFVIILAAAEAAVVLAIILALYANRQVVEVDQANAMKG
jgi:NADH-quinone oxidoreductase subunit K